MFVRAVTIVIILVLAPLSAGAVDIETDPALNGVWSIGSWDAIVFANGSFSRNRSKGSFTAKDGRIILTITYVLSEDGAEWLTKAKYMAAGNSAEAVNRVFTPIKGNYYFTGGGETLHIAWDDGGEFKANRR